MTPATRAEVLRSISSSDERIRRLKLRIRTAAQEDPTEHDPGAFSEPDPLVQWLQRGGSNTTGSQTPLTRGDAWSTAYGPLARWLWERESTGAGSEPFNRQVRRLRQRVNLSARSSRMWQVDLESGRDEMRILAGGQMVGTTGSAFPGTWYYNTTNGKVVPVALPPNSETGDIWSYHDSWTSPACLSCFGLPCDFPTSLSCGASEQTFDFTTLYAATSEGGWVWNSVDGDIWVNIAEARGAICVEPPAFGSVVVYGHISVGFCVGGPNCVTHCYCGFVDGHEGGMSYTCHQATCNFNPIYESSAAAVPCNPCGSVSREYVVDGSDQVTRYFGFHTNAQNEGGDAVFCGGTVSNQRGSPSASTFALPSDDLFADGCATDAEPVDRSIVASWSYGAIDPAFGYYSDLPAPNRDAIEFTNWTYGNWNATPSNDRYYHDGKHDFIAPVWPRWHPLRDAIYDELATGDYPDVEDFFAAESATFTPTDDPGWREVPLCGNWEGYLAFRRVGGIVEWKGTITNKQPVVGDQVNLASFLPAEALGPNTNDSIYMQAVASTPNGPLLVTIVPEHVLDESIPDFIGYTGSIYVTAAASNPTYLTGGPFDAFDDGTGLPANLHPRVQTNPLGTEEEITFDGISYHGVDIPADWSPWVSTI